MRAVLALAACWIVGVLYLAILPVIVAVAAVDFTYRMFRVYTWGGNG